MNTQHPPIGAYHYDEDMLAMTRTDGNPRVRFYRLSDTVVVLGRGSRPEKELHLEACRRDRIPLLRRRGGGCAVVVDPGNVIVTLTLRPFQQDGSRRLLAAFSRWLAGGLREMGFADIACTGFSDLALGGRKVSGACLYRSRELLQYSATVLVHPDTALMDRYLKHPPREPSYRRGRPHRQFIRALAPHPEAQHVSAFLRTLRRTLQPFHPDAALGRTEKWTEA